MDARATSARRLPDRVAAAPLPLLLVASMALGLLLALGFEPWRLPVAALAALLALLLLMAAAPRRAWLVALGGFFAQSLWSLGWIATAFVHQSSMPVWLGWVAVAGLALFLALFPTLAALAAGRLAPRPLAFVLLFAGLFVLAELLRGLLFTGFAWNPLGVVLLDWASVARWAWAIGASGLSGLLLLLLGLIAAVPWAARPRRLAALAALLLLLLHAAPLALPPAPPPGGDAPRLLLVQPGTRIEDKHSEGGLERSLGAIVAQTRAALAAGGPVPAAVVWPEATVEFPLEELPLLRRQLVEGFAPATLLLTGGVALVRDARGRLVGAHNSLYALDATGAILARYDKAHLVPGGEYLPLRAIAEPLGLARLVPGSLDFIPGPGPVTWRLPGLDPLSPNICYEIIFPAAVVDRRDRPSFLLTVSNDAWFGPAGPPQHHAQARLRAIEEGMPVVRVTPTGVSGLIGADGQMLATLPPAAAGHALVALPPPLPGGPFARLGLLVPLLVGLLLAGAGIASAMAAPRRGT